MTQLTITLTKETPADVMHETANYINRMAELLHGKSEMDTTIEQFEADLAGEDVTRTGPPLEALRFLNEPAAEMRLEPLKHGGPVAPAPMPAPPVVQALPVPGELDADGYPWDARIHAAGQGKTVTGTWRRRRNTLHATIGQVEAELRNKMAAAPMVDLPAPPAVALPGPPPPPSLAVAAPVEPTKPAGRSFDELMSLITDILVGELMAEDDIKVVLEQFDVKELSDLVSAKPETVANVYDAIEGAAK